MDKNFNKNKVILEIKTARTEEETPEAMLQFLTSLTGLKTRFFYFWRRGVPISLEIAVIDQTIHFYITIDQKYQKFIESQIVSQYPKASIIKVKDYMPLILKEKSEIRNPRFAARRAKSETISNDQNTKHFENSNLFRASNFDIRNLSLGQMKLSSGFLYPLRTYKDFKEVDPMSSLLGILSKAKPNDKIVMQFLIVPVNSSWQRKGQNAVTNKEKDASGAVIPNPYTKEITEKIQFNGFKTAVRLAVNSSTKEESRHLLFEIANSFSSFNNPSGNSLTFKRPIFWQGIRLKNALLKRSKYFMPRGQILNVMELATIFHFPTLKLATIHNVSWHKTILSEPPENLPIAEGLDTDEKKEINFFAKTEFKNKPTIFGIKAKDRRKHVYIIGKTGTGKSTLIANMIINDMRNNKGLCIIDPHGDLSEIILNYVPSFRVNDVVYLDPSDPKYAFSFNPLEIKNQHQKELVVSGIVAIFHKLYAYSWGPRLEYILRNAVLSVIDLPDATLLMVPQILTNDDFRKKALEQIKDPILHSFWTNEFEKMPDRLKYEAMSPILNKVGQFISSTTMRNIIKNPKSTIDLEKIMNEGKILIFNLSQGKIGEDNAALLGAMTITKLQLAAMNRVSVKEEERKDFYLYVDEFQNFATTSFIKILSEARKYRLNLILANQYIAQIPEDVRSSIFGNAGTMLSFLLGAEDSPYMAREFGERFKEEDLIVLGNYQAIIKLSVDGITQAPFVCQTLPLPNSVTQNKEKVIKGSRERYTKLVE